MRRTALKGWILSMKLFDAHMHCFPQKLAARALAGMSKTAGVPYFGDGTIETTTASMNQWGVDKGLFLHIATKPGQMHNVNNFAASIQSDRIFCFGSVHPYDEDVDQEIDRIAELGLHGLKFHFDYQGLMVDDPKMDAIYRRLSAVGLPMTLHAGWDPYSPQLVHAPVDKIARIADRYPALTIIAAHLGGMKRYEQVLHLLAGRENVYLDTAMCAQYCPRDLFLQIVQKHGAQRVIFGSDCPWDTSDREAQYISDCGFDEETQRAIFHDNLAKLLKIEEKA